MYSNVENQQKVNITCLHTTRLMSSTCPEDSVVGNGYVNMGFLCKNISADIIYESHALFFSPSEHHEEEKQPINIQ